MFDSSGKTSKCSGRVDSKMVAKVATPSGQILSSFLSECEQEPRSGHR